MNHNTVRRLLDDLAQVKRNMVRIRRGEISSTSPLSVKCGGADTPYKDVRAIASGLNTGDQVAVVTFGNDCLVLGQIGNGLIEDSRVVGTVGEPAFANGWGHFDPVNRPAGFYRHNGRVYLQGVVSAGTLGSAAFTLPAGCFPGEITGGARRNFAVNSNGAFGVVVVTSDGIVIPNIGNNAFFFLDGIDFRHV